MSILVTKQTQEFLEEYNCPLIQARQAAILSKVLFEENCVEIHAINQVVFNRGFDIHSTGVQILKLSALAIWFFSEYRTVSPQKSTNEKCINLTGEIYPLAAMVLELSPDNIRIQMQRFARKHSNNQLSSKLFILNVLNEAKEIIN